MAKKLTAVLVVVVLLGLTWATRAEASGVATHTWMAVRAIPRVSDPDLQALLEANYRQVEAGAHFPDSGFANPIIPYPATYGEEAHWPRFTNAYADQIAGDPSCGDLTDPTGPCAPRIAHMLGAVAHGIGDEVWDWLFEPQAPDHGESYITPGLAANFGTGGIELQMDMIAIRDYGRPTQPDLPLWPGHSRILGVFASIGRSDIVDLDLTEGEHSMRIVRAGERILTNGTDPVLHLPNHDLMVDNMPCTSAHMVTAPGGVRFAARAIAANWDSLWARLLGNQPATEVAVTYPADGENEVPATGWDRATFLPGSSANRGGARTRITAVLSSSLPYQPLPGSQSNLLPAGAMTLTEADTGTPVPIRSGYPKIVPYNSEAGEHTIDIQPDANLAPCTEYRAGVTGALLDENNEPVVPMSWTFTTDGCPGAVRRPDTQIRIADTTADGTDTGAVLGSDVYSPGGAGQNRTVTAPRGSAGSFDVEIENDGNETDRFTVTGQPAATGFKVQYFDGANGDNNVTGRVKAGTYRTEDLAPGGSATLRVVITVKQSAPTGAKITRLVTAASTGDPGAVDTVKAVVKQGDALQTAPTETAEVDGLELTPELLNSLAATLTCNLA